jgi:hypothetical protein
VSILCPAHALPERHFEKISEIEKTVD